MFGPPRRGRLAPSAVAAILILALAGAGPAAGATEPTAYAHLSERPARYSTFLDLARRAGIVGVLRSARPQTFFVPTDAAFAKVPNSRMRELRQRRSRAELRRLLLGSIVRGSRAPGALRRRAGLRMRALDGRVLTVEPRGRGLLLNGVAAVSGRGARVGNGWVYALRRAFPGEEGATLATVGGQPVSCESWSGVSGWLQCTASADSGHSVINLYSLVDGITDDKLATGITKDSLIYIVAYGGAGNIGRQPGSFKSGNGGNGGVALTATSPSIVLSTYGSVDVHYYVGMAGYTGAGNQASGGGGGASTVATMETPGRVSEWDPPPLEQILAIGGGGGGGGAAGTSHNGGSGGSGATAIAPQTDTASAAGANGGGGTKSKGGGGGNQSPYTGGGGTGGCGEPNCPGASGIGGFGGSGGTTTNLVGRGWANAPFFTGAAPQASDAFPDDWLPTPGAGGSGVDGGNGASLTDNCDFTGPPIRICGGGGGGGYGGGGGADFNDDGVNNSGGGGGGGSYAVRSACAPGSETSKIQGVPEGAIHKERGAEGGRFQIYLSPSTCVS